MKWSLFALCIGFCIDLLIGDPHGLPHPVAAIGHLISLLERLFRRLFPKTPGGERAAGACIWILTALIAAALPALLLWGCARVSVWLRLAVESVMCGQILAAKSLRDESMKVYAALKHGSLDEARQAVSMIVGRDVARLDARGVMRAAVETVAENTSDGVIAPMLFLAIGGAPLGFFYKAVNTMDSMLGYVEPPYKDIGLVPARMDDVFNFIPARLSALLMLAAGALRGTAGAAAGGRCVVPRGAAQEGLYRRREAGDRTGGHPARGAADVSDGGSGARGVRRGESAVDRSVNFEEMRCFMESKTRMAGTDTAMGSRSTFRRT